jgi:hypothetical protein
MKLTTGILLLGMAAGTAWGQNPDVIDNTKSTLKAVEQKKQMDSNAALAASQGQAANPAVPSKPVAVTPAKPAPAKPAAKPATVQATKPATGKPATTQAAKPAPSKPNTNAAPGASQSVAQSKPAAASSQTTAPALKATSTPKMAAKPATVKPATVKPAAVKPATVKPAAVKTVAVKKPAQPKQTVAVEDKKNPAEAKKETSKAINLTGRRDPFISPVVNRSMIGSGCSTGKRCLAIDQISLKGVVRAESGMIAVVVNALDKAYFLRENDPVFNGYVVKITGDSIIFKETIQDKLGKPFTREVTKKITTSAV